MTGHYYLKGMMEVGSELLLRPDGKFEFMLTNGAADYWGRGTWKAVDGAVVLTSDPSNHGAPFVLVKSEAGKAGETRVKLVGPEGHVAPNFDLWFLVPGTKGVAGRTDFDGMAVFPSSAEKRAIVWTVPMYDYQSPPFGLSPEKHDFTFEISREGMIGLMEVPFKDERLRIDNGALIMKRDPEATEARYVKP